MCSLAAGCCGQFHKAVGPDAMISSGVGGGLEQ